MNPDLTFPTEFSCNTNAELSLGAPEAISTESGSVYTVQTDSSLDASRYTIYSHEYDYTYPPSEPTGPSSNATASTQSNQTQRTSQGIPSIPSESSPGPSDTPPRSTSEPSGPSSSGELLSSGSTELWNDMGPHVDGDETHPLFQGVYSMSHLLRLETNQWFLHHLLMEHRSLAHRLLIVSLSSRTLA